MNDTERLIAIEEIKRMRARYIRMLDTRNWDELITLYTPDATLSFQTEAPGVVNRGRDEILKAIAAALADVATVHYIHAAEIEIQSADRATGIWALEDTLWFGPKSASPGRNFHAYGHMHDTYRKIDGKWLIQSADIVRLRVDEL